MSESNAQPGERRSKEKPETYTPTECAVLRGHVNERPRRGRPFNLAFQHAWKFRCAASKAKWPRDARITIDEYDKAVASALAVVVR
jgi:hypothetical protein